jgi:hypothetical protein
MSVVVVVVVVVVMELDTERCAEKSHILSLT